VNALQNGSPGHIVHPHAHGYYGRMASAAARHFEREPEPSIWQRAQPALARLRSYYRNTLAPSPYACDLSQLAYCVAYLPHYAAQLDRALRLHDIDVGNLLAPDPQAGIMCLACGPGTELVGLAHHVVGHVPSIRARPLQVTLVDHPRQGWRLGRTLVRTELEHQRRAHGLGAIHATAQCWDLLAPGTMPTPVRHAAQRTRLVTVMNVLTEVVARGSLAVRHFAQSLAELQSALPRGAVLLLADMGACRGMDAALDTVSAALRVRGAAVTHPFADNFVSPFANVDHAPLRDHLFSMDPGEGRIPRRKVQSVSLVARSE